MSGCQRLCSGSSTASPLPERHLDVCSRRPDHTTERTSMSAGPRGRIVAAALAVPLLLALAACSDGDKDKAKAAASATCPGNITQTASTPLPSDVPSPGGTVYDYNTQGKTKF